LQRELGRPFNSCLLNLYRSGRDSIGMHSDDEPELGPEPVIASLSLGAARKFHLRPIATGQKLDLWLYHGSLLCMRGTTQQRYRHGVPKCASAQPRVNLTFRLIG
jgi:alkylated DNA repair dioxygenase AlkB